ncbi:MAG: hypothetical protein IIX96_04605, partial [Clostridia bacterium]|nr:hypothetical protein [Clostridia bacterium]
MGEKPILMYLPFASSLPDTRPSTLSYKSGTVEAKTAFTYDTYKRVKKKSYTVGGKGFTKTITYNGAQISKIADSVGGTTNYSYDNMGRVTNINRESTPITFKYDTYGQLIRENNKPLDKTFIYEYNNNGSLVKI